MAGGNDGLNTVVPFADPAYRAARPRIGLTGSQLLPIDARTGLHPSLAHLHGYLDSGKLAIVQGVGYPGPDLSHFRSDDIWEKARSGPDVAESDGLARPGPRSALPADADALHAVSVHRRRAGLARRVRDDARRSATPARTTSRAATPTRTAALKALFKPGGAPNRDYVSHIGESRSRTPTAVQAAFASYTSTIAYPDEPARYWPEVDGVRARRRHRPARLLSSRRAATTRTRASSAITRSCSSISISRSTPSTATSSSTARTRGSSS